MKDQMKKITMQQLILKWDTEGAIYTKHNKIQNPRRKLAKFA